MVEWVARRLRRAKLVALSLFFVGLNFAKAEDVFGVSEITALGDEAFAQAWLCRKTNRGEPPGEPHASAR